VYDHDRAGIGLVPFPEDDPSDDIPPPEDDDRPCEDTLADTPADPETIANPLIWDPRDNRVVGNVVEDSGLADIAVGTIGDISELGNCFSDNTFTSSAPLDLEALAPCDGEGSGGDWEAGALDLIALMTAVQPPSGDYKTSPVPEPQENMPDAESAPAEPATGVPPAVDVDAIEVPAKPS
jgi:hypothetical protein